jgi:hypothetical protein
MLAPAIQVVSSGNPSGQHKITKAGTGDRAGSAMAMALATVRKSWGCGQGEDKCSCESYLLFHKHDCSPFMEEPAGSPRLSLVANFATPRFLF